MNVNFAPSVFSDLSEYQVRAGVKVKQEKGQQVAGALTLASAALPVIKKIWLFRVPDANHNIIHHQSDRVGVGRI